MNIKKEQFHEFLRFALVGGFCFLFDFGLLYILTSWCGVYYFYSSAISFTASVIINYILCVTYAFNDVKKQDSQQFIIFIVLSIIGLALNQLCMWLFVDIMAIHYLIAKIVATAVVTIYNYITKKKTLTT